MRSAARWLLVLPLRLASAYARLIGRRATGAQIDWADAAYEHARNRTAEVVHPSPHGDVAMTFLVPNEVCRYRAETFSTKEPETLEWLDRYGGVGALYDVGANVGLYSVYYAKTHPGRVFAFEPSALNLGLLARNISANGLADRVVIVPNPLTEENEVAAFHLSMLAEGGAMSTFGQDYGHDGKALTSRLEYGIAGVSLDFLLEQGVIGEPPALLKVDVDGIEHLVLRGARSTLAAPSLQSVLIEVDDSFTELAGEVRDILSAAGFMLAERRRSAMFDGGEFASTFNQIWVRP